MAARDPGASSITVAGEYRNGPFDCEQQLTPSIVRVRPFTIREAAQVQRTDGDTVFLGDGSLAAVPTPKLKSSGIRSVVKVVDDRCL